MKRQCVFRLVILSLTFCGIQYDAKSDISETINFSKSDLSFERLEGYDVVKVSGCYFTHDIATPMLPIRNVYVIIPPETKVIGVEITSYKSEELEGRYTLYPTQPSIPISHSDIPQFWVEPNDSLYNSPAPYPAECIRYTGSGSLGGERIASFQIYPIQYIPRERTCRFFSRIDFRIECEHETKSLLKYQRTERAYRMYGDVVQRIVLNPQDVKQRKGILSDDSPLEYVIVTDSTLAPAFQPLVDWKRKKGVPAEIRTVEWIHSHFPGIDLAESIRNYLKVSAQDSGTVWVLLGGDKQIIPCRSPHIVLQTTHARIPADLYYSDLDGTWDDDGDGEYGELEDNVDFYPDVWVGRAPVVTPSEVETFVNKVLAYELNSPLGYQTKTLFFAECPDELTDDGIAKDMIDDRCFPSQFHITKLYERDGNENAAAIIEAMNEGYNLLNHDGHGSINVLYTGPDFIFIPDVDGLHNSPHISGVLYSVGCWTTAIDQDCLAEHWVKNPHGGGFFIGNSRDGWYIPSFPGYGASNLLDRQFFCSLFQDAFHQIGVTLATSKIPFIAEAQQENDFRWVEYSLNLLGDPEMPLWTAIPESLEVSHPETIHVGPSHITFTVTHLGQPVPDALICSTMGKDVYSRGMSGLDGQATLSVAASSPGTLSITITARNLLPCERNIEVVTDGSWVTYQSHTIDDSTGNADGIVNPGEDIEMWIRVKNDGARWSYGVCGSLSTSDSCVTLVDVLNEFGDIGPGDTAGSLGRYNFVVSSDCPNSHVLYFDLLLSDSDGHGWRSTFPVTVGAPIVIYEGKMINDGNGGNGIAEPGEQIEILVTVKNIGLGNATRVTAWLSTTDPYLTVTSNSSSYPDMCYGEHALSSSPYMAEVGTDCPGSYLAALVLGIESDGYTGVERFNILIGATHFSDNCEGEASGWSHHGSLDEWHLTNHRDHTNGGSQSWYCGNEDTWIYSRNFTSYLVSPCFVLDAEPTFSFWTWYETESTYDFAICEINAGTGWQELGMYSGYSGGWIQKSYDLSEFSEDTVQLRFSFYSEDNEDQFEGWYIDDVMIHGCAPLGSKGDVSNDGLINMVDVIQAVNIILGIGDPPTPSQRWAADCNGDREINIVDVLGIVNVILGIGGCEL